MYALTHVHMHAYELTHILLLEDPTLPTPVCHVLLTGTHTNANTADHVRFTHAHTSPHLTHTHTHTHTHHTHTTHTPHPGTKCAAHLITPAELARTKHLLGAYTVLFLAQSWLELNIYSVHTRCCF